MTYRRATTRRPDGVAGHHGGRVSWLAGAGETGDDVTRTEAALFPKMQDDVEQADGDDDNTAEFQDEALLGTGHLLLETGHLLLEASEPGVNPSEPRIVEGSEMGYRVGL